MAQSKLVVINIRGTSGSGKTYVVKKILNAGNWKTWMDGNKILGYYNVEKKWAIIGPYDSACGGCDRIHTQQETEERIKQWLNWEFNVIFEGVVISTIFERWYNFSISIKDKANMLFCYLDTPIETCIKEVEDRRERSGKDRKFNTENTTNRVDSINRTETKFKQKGCYCIRQTSDALLVTLNQWFRLLEDK